MTLCDAGTRGTAAPVSEAQVFFVGPVVKQVKNYKPVWKVSAADIPGWTCSA